MNRIKKIGYFFYALYLIFRVIGSFIFHFVRLMPSTMQIVKKNRQEYFKDKNIKNEEIH